MPSRACCCPCLLDFSSRNCFLSDHDAGASLLTRHELRRRRKTARPRENPAARQYRPAIALPPAHALLVQQSFQLVRASVAARPQFVAWAPVPQYQRRLQCVAVQHESLLDSVAPLRGPVNHPEAEDATQFWHANVHLRAMEVNRAREFQWLAPIRLGDSVASTKNQAILLPANLHAARQRQAFAILAAFRQLQYRAHMRGVELTLARFQFANDPPHNPSADSKVPLLCALCVLSALCVEIFLPRRIQLRRGDFRGARTFLDAPLHAVVRQRAKKCLVLPRQLGKRRQMLHYGSLKLFLQNRQQFLANARPHSRSIAIRRILPPSLFLRSQVSPQ